MFSVPVGGNYMVASSNEGFLMGTSEVIEPHSATHELHYFSKILDFRTHLMKMHSVEDVSFE